MLRFLASCNEPQSGLVEWYLPLAPGGWLGPPLCHSTMRPLVPSRRSLASPGALGSRWCPSCLFHCPCQCGLSVTVTLGSFPLFWWLAWSLRHALLPLRFRCLDAVEIADAACATWLPASVPAVAAVYCFCQRVDRQGDDRCGHDDDYQPHCSQNPIN